MAATGSRSHGRGSNFDNHQNHEKQDANNNLPVSNNSLVAPSLVAFRFNSGLSRKWSSDEQCILEDLLSKYASDPIIVRYAKIARKLNDKTVRDVALRCKWMDKNEYGKRKQDVQNLSRINKDKKEKVPDSLPGPSQVANCYNGPTHAQLALLINSDDGTSYKDITGAIGQLLEQNAQALDQISGNFAAFKIQENINLFCQTRNNLLTILNELEAKKAELPKHMPPLPVKLNEGLANAILPQTSTPLSMPMQMPNRS